MLKRLLSSSSGAFFKHFCCYNLEHLLGCHPTCSLQQGAFRTRTACPHGSMYLFAFPLASRAPWPPDYFLHVAKPMFSITTRWLQSAGMSTAGGDEAAGGIGAGLTRQDSLTRWQDMTSRRSSSARRLSRHKSDDHLPPFDSGIHERERGRLPSACKMYRAGVLVR